MNTGAPGRGREQDLIRIRPQILRQLPGPVADLPRPRRRDLPGRQRARDDGMGGQPTGPPEGAARRPRGDLREGPQPGLGAVVAVGLIAVLSREGRQDLRPRRRVLRPGPLQSHQGLGLGGGPKIGGVTSGEVSQRGVQHRQRLGRARRRGGLTQGAHKRDHLPGQEGPANRGQQDWKPTARACLARQDTSLGSNPPGPRRSGAVQPHAISAASTGHPPVKAWPAGSLSRRHVHGVFRSLVRY